MKLNKTWIVGGLVLMIGGGIIAWENYQAIPPLSVESVQKNTKKENYNALDDITKLNSKSQKKAQNMLAEWKQKELNLSNKQLNELEQEYQSRMLVKKYTWNNKLLAAYNHYIYKFSGDVFGAPSPVDLRVVNLQLQLIGLDLNEEQRRLKEQELKTLLDKRMPSLRAKDHDLMIKVMKAMLPLRNEAQKDLVESSKNIRKELGL